MPLSHFKILSWLHAADRIVDDPQLPDELSNEAPIAITDQGHVTLKAFKLALCVRRRSFGTSRLKSCEAKSEKKCEEANIVTPKKGRPLNLGLIGRQKRVLRARAGRETPARKRLHLRLDGGTSDVRCSRVRNISHCTRSREHRRRATRWSEKSLVLQINSHADKQARIGCQSALANNL
jgi:hypothetical protein